MTDGSRSVYASAPFKFIVDGEPLYIHAELVSDHSKPLYRKASKGFATLEDVDTGTFVRFIEWAHRGYYTAAEFTTVEIESPRTTASQGHDEVAAVPQVESDFELPPAEYEAEPAVEPEVLPVYKKKTKKGKKAPHFDTGNQFTDDDWQMSNQQSRKETVLEMKYDPKETLFSREYSVPQGTFEIPPPRPNQSPEEDYTDVFLSHAQLYVFADKYDIQPLKMLALDELHATLAIYTLSYARTGDIVALLRYVYGNTIQSDEGEEDLRKELTRYIGGEMATLINDGDFKDLIIEDGGPLLGDFMTMVGRRISLTL